jgi:hypothetical protein
MKRFFMRAHLIFVTCFFLASSTRAAVTLISSNILNGSFESGSASPWQGGVQVIHDPGFASDGSYYASLQATASSSGAARQIAFQFLPANQSDGTAFSVSFDARIGATGFDSLEVDLLGSVETPVTFTALRSSEWSTFHTEFHLPDSWSGGNISLQLLFEKSGGTSGTTYIGFLDNIVLQQIPEPSAASFVLHAGFVVALGRLLFGRTDSRRR